MYRKDYWVRLEAKSYFEHLDKYILLYLKNNCGLYDAPVGKACFPRQ